MSQAVQSWPGVYQTHVLVLQRDVQRLDAECHRLGKQNDELCDQVFELQLRLKAAEEKIRMFEAREP